MENATGLQANINLYHTPPRCAAYCRHPVPVISAAPPRRAAVHCRVLSRRAPNKSPAPRGGPVCFFATNKTCPVDTAAPPRPRFVHCRVLHYADRAGAALARHYDETEVFVLQLFGKRLPTRLPRPRMQPRFKLPQCELHLTLRDGRRAQDLVCVRADCAAPA